VEGHNEIGLNLSLAQPYHKREELNEEKAADLPIHPGRCDLYFELVEVCAVELPAPLVSTWTSTLRF
jgi:hypothetical protein